jgi:hypothetical protein
VKLRVNWAGEAFIDTTDFQLVRVFTRLSRRVPLFVRSMGTNVSGIGYVDYKPQEDGNWFPTSYGTEYELHLFFHINRTVSVSMDMSFEQSGKDYRSEVTVQASSQMIGSKDPAGRTSQSRS